MTTAWLLSLASALGVLSGLITCNVNTGLVRAAILRNPAPLKAGKRARITAPSSLQTMALIVCVGCITMLSGCGYALVGKGSSLPDYIKNVVIKPFTNTTYQHGLETIITEAVVEEFERHGSIKVIDKESEADGVLIGVIKRYEYLPLVDKNNQITQYKIAITAGVAFHDRTTDQNYWKDENFQFMNDYFVTGQLSSSRENQQAAWEDAARDFATSLVSMIMEGF